MQIYVKWPWAPERIAERRNTVGGSSPDQNNHDKTEGQEEKPAEYRDKSRRHTAHTIVIFNI